MDDNIESKVLIREFDEARDNEVVEKLEKNCEIGSKKGISIYSNMMGDPLGRIRLYPFHIMLVAELLKNGEIVGVVRGCIKLVGTCSQSAHVKMGCMLGLRVSPRHRRKGIALRLVKSIEEWMMRNEAQYTCVATDKNNVASIKLFNEKCNYVKLSSLVIYIQPVSFQAKDLSHDIHIEKLHVEQAISFYKNRLRGKDMYPMDIDAILKENLSLGTWVSYFKEEQWTGLHSREKDDDLSPRTPSSWAIISVWNTSEVYKLQIRRPYPFQFFHATLSRAKEFMFPCLKIPILDSFHKPFGFLFLYGLDGEGERLEELTMALWNFASRMTENVKDCKMIMTELGVNDPLKECFSNASSKSFIDDLWYLKKLKHGRIDDEATLTMTGFADTVFVDPRDF
ncbi:GNAT domain [Dillenia turbinata]|uniref:GNAT domain n=1 Tax=Dillenia turbinata TaxID=194707 RepID=A0AAN8V9W8_9MAGN